MLVHSIRQTNFESRHEQSVNRALESVHKVPSSK